MQTWLITGCSTGLGRNLAEAALRQRMNVVLTARDTSSLRSLLEAYSDTAISAALDVTKPDEIKDAVRAAEERFGRIDVLVNNAGYGYRAAVEEGDDRDVADLFATNFFGTVGMIKAVLPGMRARRSGTILNISSTAGRRAAPGSGYYSASKFAVEGMSDALRKEVGPLGIRVTIVEPGGFRTDFSGRSLKQTNNEIGDYVETAGPRRKENDKTHGTQRGDPARAAEILIDLVKRKDLPVRLLLGREAVKSVSAEADRQRQEIEDWRTVSESADFA